MPSIPLAPLPQHLETVQTWTLDSVSELGRLRRELSQALLESHPEHAAAHGELTEGMVLVCSELATNAIKHGRPPTVVRLMSDGIYVLDVMDHDPVSIPAIARGRRAGEGGFGLVLTDMLAARVGWYSGDETKHIWASFPVDERRDDGSDVDS